MRILLLTQVVPYPLDSGPKIKTHSVLRYLGVRHELHLVSFARGEAEEASTRALAPMCASITTVPLRRSRVQDAASLVKSLGTRNPFIIRRDASISMDRAVDRLVHKYSFDAVHADQLGMAQFAVSLPLPLRVLDEHNAVWTIFHRVATNEKWNARRVLMELEWRKLRAYEAAMCQAFDVVTVVSEEDRLALRQGAGDFRSEVIPITVDTTELAFEPRAADARDVLSVATMFYPPNAEGVSWFGRAVFPLIRRALPNTRFYVVGSRPTRDVRRLGEENDGIIITGYVEDLAPVLETSGVLVVPLHSGSGIRVKILEAFARGIPVVSTSVGIEGIDAANGRHLLIADDDEGFAAAVVRLLEHRDEAERIARAARELVESRYDWRKALADLDRVYPSAASP